MGWTWWALGNRPVVFPVVAALVGVVLGPLAGLPWWLWISSGTLVLALAYWRARHSGGVALGLLAAALLGAWLAELSCDVTPPPRGERVMFEGEVERVGSHGLTVNVSAVDGVPTRFRSVLSTDRQVEAIPGAVVRGETVFRWVQPAANPGEWSRAAWSWRRGQPVSGSVRAERLVVMRPAPSWRSSLASVHRSLAAQVVSLSPSQEGGQGEGTSLTPAAALLLTLAAGERAELGDTMEDTFARSGLAHVLSVSGLHVAVLAFALFGALRWLLARRNWFRTLDPRALAAPLSLPIVWGYVLFTGLQGPAVRSGLMCTLLLGAWVLRRRSDPLNAIAVAALAMLVIDPASPFDLSVQLSFVAVVALVLLAPLLRRALPVEPPAPATQSGWGLRLARWREAALQTFAASLAVTLATAPIVLSAFQRVSLAGLVSNVVTLPLSGALTIVAASGAALHVLWAPLATPMLWLGLQLSRLFIAIAEAFAELPGATQTLPAFETGVAVMWWAGLAALVLLRERWRLVALVAPAAVLLQFVTPVEPGLSVTFLAVGHGDAIVLSSRGHHALIDGGGVPNGSDPGKRVVVPFLRQRGVQRLDFAALSHAHPDHGLGLVSVLDEFPVTELWLHAGSEDGPLLDALLAAAGDAEVREKEAGADGVVLGEARVEVLGPPRDRTPLEGENDLSLVLLVRHRDVSFLLTGDLESAGEAAVETGPVTVVKASHHGSDTSSTEDFVARTRPRHVVFCVGRNNRFDFPRDDVVRRWAAAGAECHRTDLDGAITFTSDGRDVSVRTFLVDPERRARRVIRE